MVKSLFQILQIYLFKKILELLQLSNELNFYQLLIQGIILLFQDLYLKKV
jgi:hypothetical protein